MEIPIFVLCLIFAIYIAIFAICGYLIFHIISERKRTNSIYDKMQERSKSLKHKIREVKNKAVKFSPDDIYKLAMAQQIEQTRTYYKSLEDKGEISLDLSVKASPPCQMAALRNALFIAEREAAASSNDGTPDWAILIARYTGIIKVYEDEITELVNAEISAAPSHNKPDATNDLQDEDILSIQEELNRTLAKVD